MLSRSMFVGVGVLICMCMFVCVGGCCAYECACLCVLAGVCMLIRVALLSGRLCACFGQGVFICLRVCLSQCMFVCVLVCRNSLVCACCIQSLITACLMKVKLKGILHEENDPKRTQNRCQFPRVVR